ncbi:MAG: hypothetical protein PVSMB7_20700 [Chloroflexota bacterium]
MRSATVLCIVILAGLAAPVVTTVRAQRHWSPGAVVQRVSRVYGEKRPRIIHLERTQTDPIPHEPMYFVGLAGHFRKGRKTARLLYFSALANRWYVWGIVAYDGHRHLLWTDVRLPAKA